jgi:hypothetical protein
MAARGDGEMSGANGGSSCVSAHADLTTWTPKAGSGSVDVYVGVCKCPTSNFAYSAMVVVDGVVEHFGGLANPSDMAVFKTTVNTQATKVQPPPMVAEHDLWKFDIVVPCPPPK